MVRSTRQVEDLLTWAKFHPRGERGVNGTGVDGRYGMLPMAEYFRQLPGDLVLAPDRPGHAAQVH